MIGKTISHFKILENLGGGGMGEVYLAEDTKLKRKVALKFLPKEFSRDPEAKKRFMEEAQSSSHLDHANICVIYDIQETDDGQLYIIMNYCQGETLQKYIKEKELSVKEILKIITQIAKGLEKAHSNGIVHCDIKPTNIIITEDEVAKMVDFGIAKIATDEKLISKDMTSGTIAYMSPEQVSNATIDTRTDIWSLGVVFYEMLTKQQPFQDSYNEALMYSIINEKPKSISELNPEVSPELEKIVIKMLAKDSKKRYQRISDLLSDLTRYKKGKLSKSEKLKKPAWQIPAYVIGFIIVFILGYTVFFKNDDNLKSIAVLAFDDLSPNKDQEYFSDGLSEELINILTKIPELKVISRTSSFSFKGKNETIKNIGEVLDVNHILEGSVRKDGDKIRITTQLINVGDGSHIWSETYDKNLNDIFQIQDEIARTVTNKLKIILFEDLPKIKIVSPEAYNLYLKANHLHLQVTSEATNKADKFLRQSIAIDSSYAPAWWLLSQIIFTQTVSFHETPIKEGLALAKAAAEKSIELDDKYSRAYGILSSINSFEWNFNSAKENIEKATMLNNQDSWIMTYATITKALLGELEEAIEVCNLSLKLDPLANFNYYNLGLLYFMRNQFENAQAAYDEFVYYIPISELVHGSMSLLLNQQGEYREALMIAENEPNELWNLMVKSIAMYNLARHREADSLLVQFITQFGQTEPSYTAVIYASIGDKDSTFQWLEKAFKQKDMDLIELLNYPNFSNLYNDPRWNALITKIGLPEEHWLMKQSKN